MTAKDRSAWPPSDSQLAALVRSTDWSATPLGPIKHWPQVLRTALEIVLTTDFPMVLYAGPELRMLYNDAFVPVLGQRHPGALGQKAAAVWADVWDQIAPRLQDVIERGKPRSFEGSTFLTESEQGRVQARYFDGCWSRIDDAAGRAVALLVVGKETTDRVLAERENARLLAQARGAAERQRRLFERAPGFIAILSGPEHRYEFVNDAHNRLFGDRGLVGKTVREGFPDIATQGIYEILDRVYATGERFVATSLPVRFQHPPDAPLRELVLDFIYEPMRDESGAVTGIFIEGHDVTERARAEAALRDSEARYRRIVEGAKDFAIVGMDADGIITSWNSGAEHLMGHTQAEAIGQPAALCFTPEDRAAHAPKQELHRARTQQRAENERWHLRKDGSRFWGSGLIMLIEDDAARGFVKIFRDKTNERRHEAEREALVAALREADARKDEFLATLAHELRNPLAPLRNVASLLKRSGPSAAQRPLLEIMDRQIGQLRRLVEDLLELSRITQGKITLKREPMRVGGAVYAALEAVQPLVDRRGQVLEARVRSSAVIKIDAARITQVITNLLNNSAKFTPEGGRITLKAFDEEHAVVVRVRDDGVGIAPEVLPRVFELFAQGRATTADQAQAGLGIGLSLVKRLVELHGGTVQAESEGFGGGATFTVRLPRNDSPADEH